MQTLSNKYPCLALFFSSDYFEQTTNVRNFTMGSLWGNIGGYVGMILGFSLLQAPDIARRTVQYLWRQMTPTTI